MRVALLGLGSVGSNFLKIMGDPINLRKISEMTGTELDIVSVTDSTGTYSSGGIPPKRLMTMKSEGMIPKDLHRIDLNEITELEPDILVDASPASKDGLRELSIYREAFKHDVSLVTANKSPLALHWNTIQDAISRSKSRFLYEATVAGGVPLFSFIRGSCAPSTITGFTGIVSLTVNVVLRRMASGMSFEEAIRECQKEGIAEADYTDDTNGLDAARKTVILANSIFGTAKSLKDVRAMGVEDAMKVQNWKERNLRIMTRITRKGNEVEIFTGPLELGKDDQFSHLGEMAMGYMINTTYNGNLFVSSAKDGPLETASAVCNDVFTISGQIKLRE